MTIAQQYQTELLAPAGSIESFFAAMEAGADAVYCGLHDFSARAKAKNFTLAEMENLCAYAHKMGRKLYIPLNTLIKEDELPRLCDVLEGIAHCQPDGLIIQDLGVYRLVHRLFPEIPIHGSTQMAVHNSAGVQMLEKLGFERAVLARELSLPEIKQIRAETSLELEHFIHGALCYSISGHCLFSSLLTGRSGNRGGCSQPCRRSYEQNKQQQFTFSTADFESRAHLPQLAENGVMSFKIEGRMKSAEYVWHVVTAYRAILDCQRSDLPQTIHSAEKILGKSGGRQTSSGFLTGKHHTILRPHQKGGIGIPAGRVKEVTGKTLSFTTAINLHIGDKLRIQPASDQAGCAFTLREFKVGKNSPKQAKKGQTLSVHPPFSHRFTAGDHIFKISTGRGFTLSEEACRRRLSTTKTTPTPVTLIIACTTEQLTITTTSPTTLTRTYPVTTYPAEKSPLNLVTLERNFKKTAHQGLQLAGISATDLAPVVIKPSELKKIRRDFYAKLSAEIQTEQRIKKNRRKETLLRELSVEKVDEQQAAPQLFIQTDKPHADLLEDPGLNLILPVATELDQENSTRKIIWDIPAIIYAGAWQKIQAEIAHKRALGQQRFRLNNIGHFRLFTQANDLQLMAGPMLYALNHQAILALQELGIEQFSTSPEDDRVNINAISKGLKQLIVQIYGKVALMTSRIPLSQASPISSKTEKFKPLSANGLTYLRPTIPFSLTGHLQDLPASGVSGYLIDLRGHARAERKQVLKAVRENKSITPSTLFNFQRGLV